MKLFKIFDHEAHKWKEGTPIMIDGKSLFILEDDRAIGGESKAGIVDAFVDFMPVVPEQVCECTGAKDSSGRLIWENDLVRVCKSSGQYEARCGVVFYEPSIAAWCIGWDFEYNIAKELQSIDEMLAGGCKFAVVGNLIQEGHCCAQCWYDDMCRKEVERRRIERFHKSHERIDDLSF